MTTPTSSYRDDPYPESFYSDDVGGSHDDGSFAMQSPELELAYDDSHKKKRCNYSHLRKSSALFGLLVVMAMFGGWRRYINNEDYESDEPSVSLLNGGSSDLGVKIVPGTSSQQKPSGSIRGSDNLMMDHHITSLLSLAYTPSKSEMKRFQPGDNSGYVSWLKEHGHEYQGSIFQPSPAGGGNSGDGVAIHWTIDDESSRILLAVAARAEGWVGFGLAEAGGMRGADMILFETEEGGRLVDSHVLSEPVPLEDDCQSWTLRRSHQTDDGYLIFEAVRLLDTNDPQDRAIPTGDFPQQVIAAWGDTPKVTHHEPTKKVRSVIRFRGQSSNAKDNHDEDDNLLSGAKAELADLAANEADIIVDLVAGDYAIPSATEFCFTVEQIQDLLLQKAKENQIDVSKINDMHLIAIEPITDQEEYVHHISIAGAPDDTTMLQWGFCNIYSPGAEIFYIWDVGADPMILPKVAGIPFGKSAVGGHKSLALEVHYNNPQQTSGLVDNSGFRLYFTTNKRQNDLGMMQVGDPQIGLSDKPVGEGLTKHKFDCPESCTRHHLKDDIIVVQEGLHMHKTGARMVNRQMRNGEEVRMSSIDYNDFYMAGQYVPPQEHFVVKPSDTFETECYYENTNGDNPRFGKSTSDEMCIVFMWYYPRQAVVDPDTFSCGVSKSNRLLWIDTQSCLVDYTAETLVDRSGFGRTFGFRKNKGGEDNVADDAVCK